MEQSQPQTPSDRDLIERVLAGDRSHYDALVERYWRLVYAIGYAHLGHRETTEDLTQEVFLRVFLHLEDFDPDRPFTPWLSRITRNLAINWSRAGKRRSSLIVMLPEDHLARLDATSKRESELDKMMRTEEADMIRRMVQELPTEQREVVVLHYMEGMNKREIADKIGVHPATVGRQLQRAEKTLRDELISTLRQTLPAARATSQLLPRTLSLIGAAAVLSGEAKSILMTAAGGLQQLGNAASVAQASAAGLLAPLGFFWAWVVRLLALATAGLATVCGVHVARDGVDWQWLLNGSGDGRPVSAARPPVSAEDERAMQQARAAFATMQRLAAAGHLEALIDCYDLRTWEHLTGLDPNELRAWMRRNLPGLARVIAAATVERVWVDRKGALELEVEYEDGRPNNNLYIQGPLIGVKAGQWRGRFVQRLGQWKLLDQQLSGEFLEREGMLFVIQVREVN